MSAWGDRSSEVWARATWLVPWFPWTGRPRRADVPRALFVNRLALRKTVRRKVGSRLFRETRISRVGLNDPFPAAASLRPMKRVFSAAAAAQTGSNKEDQPSAVARPTTH